MTALFESNDITALFERLIRETTERRDWYGEGGGVVAAKALGQNHFQIVLSGLRDGQQRTTTYHVEVTSRIIGDQLTY